MVVLYPSDMVRKFLIIGLAVLTLTVVSPMSVSQATTCAPVARYSPAPKDGCVAYDDGGIRFSLLAAKWNSDIFVGPGFESREKPNGVYLSLFLWMTNIGERPKQFSLGDLTLEDSSKRIFAPSFVYGSLTMEMMLNPGVTSTPWELFFDLPVGVRAKNYSLVLRGSSASKGVKIPLATLRCQDNVKLPQDYYCS